MLQRLKCERQQAADSDLWAEGELQGEGQLDQLQLRLLNFCRCTCHENVAAA